MNKDALFNIVRPVTFKSVVGQDATISAIKTGLMKGSFEHSAIFYGQTGGGKTTVSRIVGSYLNCIEPNEGEPCCSCVNCRALREGNFADYKELNAATNGGKDDIDNLIADVDYLPVSGKAKIFVIDEAHCLTSAAWKSLLKVLEEPPTHVYFILCTTNMGAIPPEILNRCGKYVFKSVSYDVIYAYLCELRQRYTHMNYSDEALALIAKESNGSMRDAVNNYSHIHTPYPDDFMIGESEVKRYLNLVSPSTMVAFLRACCELDIRKAITIINDCEEMSIEAETFLNKCISIASDVITVSCGGKVSVGSSDEYASLLEGNKLDIRSVCLVSDKLSQMVYSSRSRNYNALRIAVGLIATECTAGGPGATVMVEALIRRVSILEDKLEGLCNGTMQIFGGERVKEVSSEIATVDNTSFNDMSFDEASPVDNSAISEVPSIDETEEVESKECEQVNSLFALFGSGLSSDSNRDDCNVEVQDSEEVPVTPEFNAEDLVSKVDDENSFLVGNIYFSDAELAEAFVQAGSDGNKANNALNELCGRNSLIKLMVDTQCKKEVTANEVVLATPFRPTFDVLVSTLEYENIKGINVVVCDGLQL